MESCDTNWDFVQLKCIRSHSVLIVCFSQNWYKEANKKFMPTGFSLPHDTPLIKQAKINSVITSNVSVSLSSVLQLSCSLESN